MDDDSGADIFSALPCEHRQSFRRADIFIFQANLPSDGEQVFFPVGTPAAGVRSMHRYMDIAYDFRIHRHHTAFRRKNKAVEIIWICNRSHPSCNRWFHAVNRIAREQQHPAVIDRRNFGRCDYMVHLSENMVGR